MAVQWVESRARGFDINFMGLSSCLEPIIRWSLSHGGVLPLSAALYLGPNRSLPL